MEITNRARYSILMFHPKLDVSVRVHHLETEQIPDKFQFETEHRIQTIITRIHLIDSQLGK